MDLSTSTVFVTGANRGLGRALAVELLDRGATVYAGARNPDGRPAGRQADRYRHHRPHLGRRRRRRHRRRDRLINNAGSSTGSNLLTGDLGRIRLEIGHPLLGTLWVVRAFPPRSPPTAAGRS